MNNREQQRKFSERTTISNSTFDVMNTTQSRYSNGQGENALPVDKEQLRTSNYYVSTGLIYFTGVIVAIILFIFVVPLCEFIVTPAFYNGPEFLLCAILFCVVMGYVWIYIGAKVLKKGRR
ncbi:hypothetical protein [Enterococcus caccae]|uniref:Uncharacterized protein n=1 Tax=Enterococcus caccae ATCC BAA-1240 TaxID=1158612 RepID=R3W763_9ENTE|nr:hypothetical protein [Enterococcus caccae]EOL43387.1 hypothetical protein UC7_02716 [Enterococcus caccae ATCC BAA-1240]EOT68213.1 hypothetical protein I580_00596 [Enterococcus caccae ATCC BAA-1240]